MATDHHNAQDYLVNGPTNAGFKTGGNGTGIANGVVAEGNVFGVHGIGLGTVGSSAETVGVYGESIRGIGVKGQSEQDYGVQGETRNNQSAGVYGVGVSQGVVGKGATGVVGRGDTTGVRGEGDEGFGVDGYSKTSAGVHGSSTRDRGGVFESEGRVVAQVRLVPHVQDTDEPHLSKNGKVGDLFLIRHTGTHVDESFDFCSLWLCVPENPKGDESSRWRQVTLGQTVTGTW